jgi:hypothetical protein
MNFTSDRILGRRWSQGARSVMGNRATCGDYQRLIVRPNEGQLRRRSVLKFKHDQNVRSSRTLAICRTMFARLSHDYKSNLVVTRSLALWLGFDIIIDFAATNFGHAITHDFDDQLCAVSTIYPRLQKKKNRLYVDCKQVASLVWLG